MPCRDYEDTCSTTFHNSITSELRKEIEFLEAALCMFMSASEFGDTELNFKEAGVTESELNNWWQHHKTIDATRRKKEKAEKAQLKAIEKALSKLTPAERKLIGK